MSGIEADCLLVIIPELYDSQLGYELGVVWPGLKGTHRTDFHCGHDLDLAIEWANEHNALRGHTPAFTTKALELVSGMSKIHFFNT